MQGRATRGRRACHACARGLFVLAVVWLTTPCVIAQNANAQKYFNQALQFIHAKNDLEAIRFLKDAIRADPSWFAPRVALADIKYGLKIYPEAVEQMEVVLLRPLRFPDYDLQGNNVQAEYWTRLGEYRFENEMTKPEPHKFDLALRAFQKATGLLEKNRRNASRADAETLGRAYFYLAHVSLASKDYAKAQEHIKSAISMQPGNHAYHILQAEIHAQQGELEISASEAKDVVDKLSSVPSSSDFIKANDLLRRVRAQINKRLWKNVGLFGGPVLLFVILVSVVMVLLKRRRPSDSIIPGDFATGCSSYEEISVVALRRLAAITRMTRGVMYVTTLDGDEMVPKATLKLEPEDAKPMPVDVHELPRWTERNDGKPFLFKAERKEASFIKAFPEARELMEPLQIRIGVPLLFHDRVLGIAYLGIEESKDIHRLKKLYDRNQGDIYSVALEISAALYRTYEDELADVDVLTKLKSRRYIEENLPRALVNAEDAHCKGMVAMAELDQFLSLQEQYGDAQAESVLKAIAAELKPVIQDKDCLLARFEGGKLFVYAPVSVEDDARQLAEKIRARVAETRISRNLPSPTASVGVALFPDHSRKADDLICAADRVMMGISASGGNSVAFADTSMHNAAETGDTGSQRAPSTPFTTPTSTQLPPSPPAPARTGFVPGRSSSRESPAVPAGASKMASSGPAKNTATPASDTASAAPDKAVPAIAPATPDTAKPAPAKSGTIPGFGGGALREIPAAIPPTTTKTPPTQGGGGSQEPPSRGLLRGGSKPPVPRFSGVPRAAGDSPGAAQGGEIPTSSKPPVPRFSGVPRAAGDSPGAAQGGETPTSSKPPVPRFSGVPRAAGDSPGAAQGGETPTSSTPPAPKLGELASVRRSGPPTEDASSPPGFVGAAIPAAPAVPTVPGRGAALTGPGVSERSPVDSRPVNVSGPRSDAAGLLAATKVAATGAGAETPVVPGYPGPPPSAASGPPDDGAERIKAAAGGTPTTQSAIPQSKHLPSPAGAGPTEPDTAERPQAPPQVKARLEITTGGKTSGPRQGGGRQGGGLLGGGTRAGGKVLKRPEGQDESSGSLAITKPGEEAVKHKEIEKPRNAPAPAAPTAPGIPPALMGIPMLKDAPIQAAPTSPGVPLLFSSSGALTHARPPVQIKDTDRDARTGFIRSDVLKQVLGREIERSRARNEDCSVLYFQIDKRSEVSATIGTDKLEVVQRQITSLVKDFLKEGSDVPGLWDEGFAIVLPRTSSSIACNLAEQIRFTVSNLSFPGVDGSITLSLGIAAFPQHAISADPLLNAAREAASLAEKDGGNKYKVFGS